MDEIQLPVDLHEEMIRHATTHYPEEACGLLAGVIDGHTAHVTHLFPIENVRHSSVAYEMEPQAQVRAMIAIESEGLELVGIFHSHPVGPTAPSPSDVAQAYYPDTAYIIISLAERERPSARAFLLHDGQIDEIRLSRGA